MSRKGRHGGGESARSQVITVSHPPLGQRADYLVGNHKEPLPPGTQVVIDGKAGLALGTILRSPDHVPPGTVTGRGKRGRDKLVRVATRADLDTQRAAKQLQPGLMRQALRYIRDKELPLRLVQLDVDGVARRATLCILAAEERDISGFAQGLGRAIGMRVQLRQLGDREQARVLGGVGRCGRPQCCSSHLDRYPKVSIKMAKVQGVPLGDEKTAGNCGRMLCCLNYESDFYEAYHRFLPRIAKRATTVDGLEGRVVGVDVLRQTFTIRDEEGKRRVLPAAAWDKNRDKDLPEPELDSGPLVERAQAGRLPVLDASEVEAHGSERRSRQRGRSRGAKKGRT